VSDELLVTTDGAVRIVTINRPDSLNVINATLHHKLLDVWRDLERDTGARCGTHRRWENLQRRRRFRVPQSPASLACPQI
jgi:hypothetical protein